jgi:hypothetical protein
MCSSSRRLWSGSFTAATRWSSAAPPLLIRHTFTAVLGSESAEPRAKLVVRRIV